MNNREINKINPKHNLFIIRSYGQANSIIKLSYSQNIHSQLRLHTYSNPFVELVFSTYREDANELKSSFNKLYKSDIFNT